MIDPGSIVMILSAAVLIATFLICGWREERAIRRMDAEEIERARQEVAEYERRKAAYARGEQP